MRIPFLLLLICIGYEVTAGNFNGIIDIGGHVSVGTSLLIGALPERRRQHPQLLRQTIIESSILISTMGLHFISRVIQRKKHWLISRQMFSYKIIGWKTNGVLTETMEI